MAFFLGFFAVSVWAYYYVPSSSSRSLPGSHKAYSRNTLSVSRMKSRYFEIPKPCLLLFESPGSERIGRFAVFNFLSSYLNASLVLLLLSRLIMYRFGILIAVFCALVESFPQIADNLIDIASVPIADDRNSHDSNDVLPPCVDGESNELFERDLPTDTVSENEGSAENSNGDSLYGKPTQRHWMREVEGLIPSMQPQRQGSALHISANLTKIL